MDLMDRRRMMTNKTRIPYDSEVEYLESSGGAVIDTGLMNSDIDGYYIEFSSAYSKSKFLFGNYLNNNSAITGLRFTTRNDGTMYSNVRSLTTTSLSSTGYVANGWNQAWGRVSGNMMYFKLNSEEEVSIEFVEGNATTRTVVLFGQSLNGTKGVSKISRAQFMKNGILVRDFIPVRVGTVGYMYDNVTKQLFGNAYTSGSFVLGNDIN